MKRSQSRKFHYFIWSARSIGIPYVGGLATIVGKREPTPLRPVPGFLSPGIARGTSWEHPRAIWACGPLGPRYILIWPWSWSLASASHGRRLRENPVGRVGPSESESQKTRLLFFPRRSVHRLAKKYFYNAFQKWKKIKGITFELKDFILE